MLMMVEQWRKGEGADKGGGGARREEKEKEV